MVLLGVLRRADTRESYPSLNNELLLVTLRCKDCLGFAESCKTFPTSATVRPSHGNVQVD
jgi:hypothetical protein